MTVADDYTPTTDEVRLAFSEMSGWDMSADEADAAFDRWLGSLRAEWEAERGAEEPEGEHVFIERYGMYHAKFGGIGGDAMSLTITREAWKSLGEPDVLAVSWVPVNENEGTDRENGSER